MTTLLKLHPVTVGSVGRAVDFALEYRGRLPEVWIVRELRGDKLYVMQPTVCGGEPAPGAVEIAYFENTAHNRGEPFFRIVFGPGVMYLTEGRSCLEKVEV